jgi:hypothetical protein
MSCWYPGVIGGLGVVITDDGALLAAVGAPLPPSPMRSCWNEMSGDGSFFSTTFTGGDTLLLPVLDGAGGGGELLGAFILLPPAVLEGLVLPPALCCCWGCWRCLALRFLNQT